MSAADTDTAVAFIGLGSNLGDSVAQIDLAVDRLGALEATNILSRSALYRSAPLGPVEQGDFVNAVVSVQTRLGVRRLFTGIQSIECAMGRSRDGVRWGPRLIDLDLLVFGDEVISEHDLTVPHPGIAGRNFVLLPLLEIAPDLVIPGLGPLADIAIDRNEPRIERID